MAVEIDSTLFTNAENALGPGAKRLGPAQNVPDPALHVSGPRTDPVLQAQLKGGGSTTV
jgi:hypothetical protein